MSTLELRLAQSVVAAVAHCTALVALVPVLVLMATTPRQRATAQAAAAALQTAGRKGGNGAVAALKSGTMEHKRMERYAKSRMA